MIEIQDVTKIYGRTTALRGISTRIERGEVVGLLGPNGAGKTTAMKIVVGYLLPTSGSVRVGGHDVVLEPLEVQRQIGYLPENAPLYTDMLVQDYLEFTARMRGLTPGAWRRRLVEVAGECGIEEVLTRPIGHLSKGYRQRVGLAAAILHDPAILILDEPTTGLDPNQIMEVRRLIRRLGETKTVILSTHILPEVEASCGRAVILIDGRIRADGSLDELTRSRVQVVTIAPGNEGEAREVFARIPGVRSVTAEADDGRFLTFRLELGDGADGVAEAVADAVRERAWPLRELRRDDKSLEQVFRELTESAVEEAA
ncbi:MAG: ATP-binding cassette domain-containing protein [Acidobacteria bacterium]|nr:MAG: ATP-binding cassette domain-containing protein [Acidobacteriota bacterium]